MRKLVAALAVMFAVGLAAPAHAADILGGGDSAKDSYPAERAFTWTGFYIGGQVGLGISNTTVTNFNDVSRCWSNLSWRKEGVKDQGTEDTADDVNWSIGGTVFDLIKTNLTEEQCEGIVHEFGTQVDGDWTYNAGYAPEGSVESITHGSQDGFEGGLTVGADLQIQRFVVGLFGEYNWSTIDGKDGDWAIGGRGGILLLPRVLAYGSIAYAQADYGDWTFDGARFAGGLEVAVSENVFLGGQYSFTDYESERVGPVEIDLDEHKIMATAKYKLNGGFSDLGF